MGKLDKYVCDGQMDIFNFLQVESDSSIQEPEVEAEKVDYWKQNLMDRVHPRVKHLFTQMMKGPKSDTHRYILQCYAYNNTLERMTEVCQTTYGTGGFTTDKGVVSYDSKGWIYKYNEPWEGVYQEQYTWREFAREIIKLIKAKVYVDDFEPICEHSLHTCNAKELWKVADSLETECPHTCCRSCKVRMCGARCNGSTEPKEKANKYPNCSEAEIKYILPILRIDACDYMRERIYKDIKGGMPDEQLCKLLKYCYRDWRREKGVEHEHIFNFPKDMRYQSAITYPDGMELRRKPGDTHGCNVMPWSHVLLLIKDMIAAGDYVEVPQVKTKPTLMPGYTCEHDHKCWCNRYGNELPMEEYKTELIKGYSCAGCCYYCKESPIHGGKCKWDCRLKKTDSSILSSQI